MSAGVGAEDSIVQQCAAGRYDEATADLLRLYGAEVTGLLVALARDDAQAADAYSLFCERTWRSLPQFRFESSLRTWAYVLARRSMSDVRRGEHRGPVVLAASPSQLPDIVQQVRSTTQAHLRTTNKRKLDRLRQLLSPEDQLLLVLRLDRDMAWDEIARVFSDEDHPEPQQLGRSAAALRKRFSRAKSRLSAQLRAQRESERE